MHPAFRREGPAVKVIQIVGRPDGGTSDVTGKYVRGFDPDAHGGRGTVEATSDPSLALQFEGFVEAMEFWRTPSTVLPVRPDGKPNRPLTAYHVHIHELEELCTP